MIAPFGNMGVCANAWVGMAAAAALIPNNSSTCRRVKDCGGNFDIVLFGENLGQRLGQILQLRLLAGGHWQAIGIHQHGNHLIVACADD